jgi:hypothetical protein
MKTVLVVLVFFLVQAIPESKVRETFRKAVIKAALAINRQDGSMQRRRDSDSALDEVDSESNSKEESSVVKLLYDFSSQIQSNNAIRATLDNQVKADAIFGKPDLSQQYARVRADREEMDKRENACSNAIQDMVRTKLNDDLPACKNVVLEKKDRKTVMSPP